MEFFCSKIQFWCACVSYLQFILQYCRSQVQIICRNIKGLTSGIYSFSSSKRHSERRIYTSNLTDSEAIVLKQVFFKTFKNSCENSFLHFTIVYSRINLNVAQTKYRFPSAKASAIAECLSNCCLICLKFPKILSY